MEMKVGMEIEVDEEGNNKLHRDIVQSCYVEIGF